MVDVVAPILDSYLARTEFWTPSGPTSKFRPVQYLYLRSGEMLALFSGSHENARVLQISQYVEGDRPLCPCFAKF